MSKPALPELGRVDALSPGGMHALAARLSGLLAAGDTLALHGEMGAGKTSFARALITPIAIGSPEVTSPTYTLMQAYDVTLKGGAPETVWHLDLCRLDTPAQVEALGLEELWPHIVLIEWPQVALSFLPESRLDIAFGFGAAQDTRTLTFAGNDAWRRRLAGII